MVDTVLLRLIAKAATVETTNVAQPVNVVMNNGGAGTQPVLASRDADSEPTLKREPATVATLKPNRLISRTVILPSVVNALLLAIGTTPAIAGGMAIAVVPSTKNAKYLIQTGSVAVPALTRM
jgi:hypothetical protein